MGDEGKEDLSPKSILLEVLSPMVVRQVVVCSGKRRCYQSRERRSWIRLKVHPGWVIAATMFGKSGRCASLGVRARQCSSSTDSTLNPSLRTSLRLVQKFIEVVHLGSCGCSRIPFPFCYARMPLTLQRDPGALVLAVLVHNQSQKHQIQ